VVRETETVNPMGEAGTKSPANRFEMRAQNLSGVSSAGISDLRLHDGSGDSPVGVYRGDGDGGWVKISDNSTTV
jgi:hypothetical protein